MKCTEVEVLTEEINDKGIIICQELLEAEGEVYQCSLMSRVNMPVIQKRRTTEVSMIRGMGTISLEHYATTGKVRITSSRNETNPPVQS